MTEMKHGVIELRWSVICIVEFEGAKYKSVKVCAALLPLSLRSPTVSYREKVNFQSQQYK
jgi:hypothetical protein